MLAINVCGADSIFLFPLIDLYHFSHLEQLIPAVVCHKDGSDVCTTKILRITGKEIN